VEIVRSPEDRIVCVLHVATEPVTAPRRGHELHRALGPGRARAAQLAELRLDEVDGRKDIPGHPEPALRLAVVGQQLRCRSWAGDLDRLDADRGSEAIELALRREKISADLRQVWRNERKRAG